MVFCISSSISLIVIGLSIKFSGMIHVNDHHGVQKVHAVPTPRIGGVSVFLAFSYGLWMFQEISSLILMFWLALLPVFLIGLIEDITLKVSPVKRLLFTFISIFIAYYWMDIRVSSIAITFFDELFFNFPGFSLLFTLLIVGGAVHSLNIIDGFNGLLGGYAILALSAVACVAHSLGDIMIIQLSLITVASLLGFLVFNFPFGKIFIGDGGAYVIGFILAIIGLTLVDRHPEISNWFVLLIFVYPITELVYSIYRRKIVLKTPATQADAEHLHSLIYKKLMISDWFKHDKAFCNNLTSLFLWLMSLFGIIPSVVWFDNKSMLITSVLSFMILYIFIYRVIYGAKIEK